MEHTSELVADGGLLHETSYPQRAERMQEVKISYSLSKEIDLLGQIDFYDQRKQIIHETKRSNKIEKAHEWQSKFYIYLFELNGINNIKAILEYPKLRITSEVLCTEKDKEYLNTVFLKIIAIIRSPDCPPTINSSICKSCSYYELCYVQE